MNKVKPVRIIGLSAFAVVIITLLGSCGSRTEEKRLSDIESYIDSRPVLKVFTESEKIDSILFYNKCTMKKILYLSLVLWIPLLFGCEQDDNPSDKLIERKDFVLTRSEMDFIQQNNGFALELFKRVAKSRRTYSHSLIHSTHHANDRTH